MFTNNDINALRTVGVNLGQNVKIGNRALAMDAAQTHMITQSSAGIPAWLANYVDPEVIRVLMTPMKAAEVFGEEKKGDWTTKTTQFGIIEATGMVAAYGDFSNNGNAGANVNFAFRQSFLYQVITQYGELEQEMYGLANVNLSTEQDTASVLTLNKFQNKSYLFGIAGMQNYGVLNDPSLSAPITPTAKWNLASTDGAVIYADIARLFAQLMTQTGGIVDMNTSMTLIMSPLASVALTKTNQYNVNVTDQLTKNFPNLKIEVVPEYSTAAGEVVQLIVDEVEGQKTVVGAYNEKLRQHAIVRDLSSFKQKKSQGTWGAIVKRPNFIAQMLGV